MKRTFNNAIQEENEVDKKILKNLLGEEDYKEFKLELKAIRPKAKEKRAQFKRKSIMFNTIEVENGPDDSQTSDSESEENNPPPQPEIKIDLGVENPGLKSSLKKIKLLPMVQEEESSRKEILNFPELELSTARES